MSKPVPAEYVVLLSEELAPLVREIARLLEDGE